MSSLADINLDDRSFQDIVDEAKKLIPHYTPEWSDHNVSDPGVTLIELFAWMTETILYRLNRVPTLHAVRLMEMLGVTLAPPEPATTTVTFWLTEPKTNEIIIPAGTEVATTQTETQLPIIFTTEADLKVIPPVLSALVSRIAAKEAGAKRIRPHDVKSLQKGLERGVGIFTDAPEAADALYFGFSSNLSHHVLQFDMNFEKATGAGVRPESPPYTFEAYSSHDNRWVECTVGQDTTNAFNTAGTIQIHLPDLLRTTLPGISNQISNREPLYWVRAMLRELTDKERDTGAKPFNETPRMLGVQVSTWGGAVPATHSQIITREFLGRSDGSAGQTFHLQQTPILARDDGEYLEVITSDGVEQWMEVADFADSSLYDKHYVLDSMTGEIRFGPAIRQPKGELKVYGAVPPRNANLRFTRYRIGGGISGNITTDRIDTLKTAIPYVAKIRNRQPAINGKDAESIEDALVRAPQLLRSKRRAVTESDYEFLAREAAPEKLSRIKCLHPRPLEEGRVQPNRVFVMAIPAIDYPRRRLTRADLALDDAVVKRIEAYLDERRLLTVHVDVRPPTFRGVAVKVRILLPHGASAKQTQDEALDRLYSFINPVVGGADGRGWEFGRDITTSDIYSCLHGIPLARSFDVQMHDAPVGGTARGPAVQVLDVFKPYGIVASGLHEVEIAFV